MIYGRRPRIKTQAQILAELDALVAEKVAIAFIVDDNLIGNKRAIKEILRAVVVWQQARGYPLTFFTEASLDLGDDPELMDLMVDANILSVFVGIETPNEAALRETKKLQNLPNGGATMAEQVHTIQRAGLEVWSGMILGFDSDDATIFAAQARFVAEARIVSAMVGMLVAIPKTPLYARLAIAGRLDLADPPAYGTNVIPLQIGRAALLEGYRALMTDLAEPDAYFDRLEALYLEGGLGAVSGRRRYWRRHPWRRLTANAVFVVQTAVLFARLMRRVPESDLRRQYRRRLWRIVAGRREPGLAFLYVLRCAIHYHNWRLAKDMAGGRIVNAL